MTDIKNLPSTIGTTLYHLQKVVDKLASEDKYKECKDDTVYLVEELIRARYQSEHNMPQHKNNYSLKVHMILLKLNVEVCVVMHG